MVVENIEEWWTPSSCGRNEMVMGNHGLWLCSIINVNIMDNKCKWIWPYLTLCGQWVGDHTWLCRTFYFKNLMKHVTTFFMKVKKHIMSCMEKRSIKYRVYTWVCDVGRRVWYTQFFFVLMFLTTSQVWYLILIVVLDFLKLNK